MKRLVAIVFILGSIFGAAIAQETPEKAEKKKQFIFVLKLDSKYLDEKNWTDRETAIVGRHFRRLQQLHKEGKVLLAGRTLNESQPSQFGIVILSVATEQEAREIMEGDDAVKEKLMTGELFPFTVAIGK